MTVSLYFSLTGFLKSSQRIVFIKKFYKKLFCVEVTLCCMRLLLFSRRDEEDTLIASCMISSRVLVYVLLVCFQRLWDFLHVLCSAIFIFFLIMYALAAFG